MKTKRYSLLVLSVFLILLVFIASASAADSNETDVLAADGPTNTIDEKLALDYSTEVSAVANDSNVIENDKEILQVANSENVLGDDYNVDIRFPKTIDIGKDYEFTFDISYMGYDNNQELQSGYGRIKIGDYEKEEHFNSPHWETMIVNYDKSPGSFTGSFEYEDEFSGTKVTRDFKVTVRSGPGTIYVNSSADSGGDGSEASPFQNMQYALEAAGDSDTIMIAAGTYTGYYNRWLTIENNNLTLTKYGDGEAIFDEEDCRFFTSYVDALTININGLTFKNADYVFYSEFRDMKDSTINATFINIGNDGGCPIFLKSADNVDITGKFINNPGKLINIKQSSSNVKIHDAIFINNNGDSLFNIEGSSNQITNCWFGNNATNYTSKPDVGNFEMNDWLFLNATADSSELGLGESSKITFDLYSYDSGSTAKYDASKMNLNLDLTQTLGELDKDAASLGEEVVYTARQGGDAEVTATFETASYAVGLTNFAGIWYVNGSKTSSGNGKSEENAFKTLKEAISAAGDGQTIMIAAGTYAGLDNIGLMIEKNNLNLVKYGDGEAIFDGQSAGEMLYLVTNSAPKSINIKGLTFKNAMLYAIAFYGDYGVSDSSINATFINIGTGQWGSAIFAKSADNVDITGIFINNNAGEGLIQMPNSKNIRIHDSIFINNGENTLFKINESSIIDNNWFGNNATNYDTAPANAGITLDNWLFLNATANPSELGLGENSKITFKLSSYGGTVSDYIGPIDIQLDLTQTLGELDKDAALLGEEITYTAKQSGDASVTATFETASYTISLTNADPRTPTEINVTNSTLDLKVNDEIDAGATLTPADAGNLTYTSSNSSVAIVENGKIKAISEGSATITVSFAGDNVYAAAENKTIDVTVALRDASVTVDEDSMDLFIGGEGTIDAYTTPEGLNVNFKSNNESVVTVDANGKVTTVGLGNTTITVSVGGDGVYALNSTDVTVNVDKITTEILVTNETFFLKALENVSAGATLIPDAGNLTYASSNTTVAVVQEGIIKALKKGIATITISFEGNGTHAAATKTIDVTVDVNDASVSVDNYTLELLVNGNFTIVPITVPEGLKVTYSSSNDSVVWVNETGGIYALDIGTATVTLSVGGDGVYALNTTEVKVTVKGPTEIIVENTTVDMKVGDNNATVNATLIPDVAGELDFTSSDVSVVTVNGIGELIAVGEGTANITVSFGGNDKYAAAQNKTVTVTVRKIDTSISVTNTTVDMEVNDSTVIDAALTPVDAGELDFTSSDVSVVTVNGIGELYAVGDGIANITVSFGGNDKYAAAESKIIAVTVSLKDASVSVNNSTLDLFVDDTFTINATTAPAGLDVTYVPDNSGVVSVDENGTVTALKEGSANITVKVGGDGVYALNTTNVAVKVSKIPTAITVLNDTFEFKVAEGITYFANLTPVDAGELNYNSSNDDVAIIFAGAIVAVGEGEANVTVSFDGNEKYAAAESKIINVKVTLRDASVSVENDTLDLLVGDLEFINATAVPETLTINYASSNESVVIVDKDGYVLAMGEGSAVITLSVGDGKVFAENSTTVAVSVKKIPTEIEIAAKSIDLIVRENASAGATLLPSEAGNLTYVSSNELVAKVVDGMIVAVGEGNATITVSFAGDYKYATAESKTIDVSVKKTDSSMDIEPKVVELIVGQEATVTVVLPEDATGVVLVDVAGKKYYGDVENGNATVNLVGLTPGNYTADVVYPGDDKYSNASGSVDVKVAELSVAKVNITVPEVKVGEVAKVIVELPKDATGIFVVHVDSKVVAVSSASIGPFELPLGEFSAGNHTIYVIYSGDEKYYENGVYRMFAVEKLFTDVTAEPVSIYEEETAVVVVSVDVNATGTVLVSVGDNKYYGDVENGNATVEVVGLAAGNYTAAITYLGDDKYANATGSVDIKVAKRIIPDGRISVPEVNVGEVAKLIAELPEDADGKLFVIVDGMSTIYADAPGGTVEIPLGVLSAGNHSAVIMYSGNRIYAESYDSTNFTVVKLSTDVTAEPVEIFKGETAIVVINVDVNATGTVLVDVEGNKYYGVVENGTASVNVTGLAPGNYTADITYIGDDKYGESTGNVSVKVNKLIIPEGGISVPEVNVGEVAKVIAELPEDATGKVAVIVDGKNVTEVPVSGGTVEVPLGVLSAGNHSVAVMYFGNQKYDFCYDFKNFTVAKLSTDVSAEPVDIVVGEIAVVNVAVDVNATGVVFVDIDGNKYCADVFEGNAFVNIEALSVGNYTAVMTYQGDDRYAEATGSVDIKVAALMDPKVNVTVPEVKVGEQAKVIVELPENATGNVMAIVEGKGIVIVPVSGGTVEIPLGKLSAGNHSVMVSYSGNDIYDLCYEFVNFTVAKLSTDVTAEPVEIIEGEIAVVNVAVDVNATGVVFVDIGGNKYCADVYEGNAFVNVEALSAGNYTAVITYQGDEIYAEATGSVDIKVAALMDPKVNVTVPAVNVGETAKAIVELPENATGNVAAIVDGKDIAVLLVSGGTVEIPLGELSAGNHTVLVIYSGNDKYIMSGAEKEIAVAKLSTDVSAEPVEIIEGEIAVINVAVDANATGVVFVDIDGNKYCADVFEGNAFVNVEVLSAGNYTAVITYQGDERYAEATGSVAVKVADLVTPDVNITVPALKVGEDAKVIVELPENATGNVIARVDGKDVSALIVSGGTVELPLGELSAGNHTVWVVYSGDGKFAGKAASSEITVDKLTTNISADSAEIKEGEAAIINVTVDAKATGIVLVDIDGNKYYGDVVDGKASVKVVGLTDGTFTANVIYQGDDVYDGATTSSIVSVAQDVRLASQFNVTAGTSIATYAVDFAMHEPGTNYKFRLTDSEGNPIVNATVDFAYKTTYFNRTTDENGCVNLGINTQIAGEYLCALSYLGDDKHNATFVPFNFNIQKKSMTISASAKSYKASASTKKYTVTLKTQKAADGKTYLKAGKKVTMKINGKTYTAKTGSDGKATFNIKLTKKGKFTAAINFAGDATYEAASKKVKITIK